MSSARCRMAIGPAVARLRQYMEAAQSLVDAEDPDFTEIRRAKERIQKKLSDLEREQDRWESVLNALEGEAREQEEAIFTGFEQEGQHFMARMEDAREQIAQLDDELRGELEVEQPAPGEGQHEAARDPPQQQNHNGGGMVAPAISAARLPQLSLPTFSGDALEWLPFWQSFESSVDRLPLADVDKLNYLQGCLKGKAARALAGYRGGDNYIHAVDALQRLYGDRRKVSEALQAELINLRAADDSVESIQVFAETVERVCRQLMDLGQDGQNPFMYQVVRNKLPRPVLAEMVKMEREAGGGWGMAELRAGLAEILAVREEVQRCSGGTRGDKPRQIERSEHREQRDYGGRRSGQARVFSVVQQPKSSGGKKPDCLFCGKDHWASECTNVTGIGKRRQMLVEQSRCFNCLRRGHRDTECRGKQGCRQCNERHHRAICPQQKGRNEPRDRGHSEPSRWNKAPRAKRQDGPRKSPATGANAVTVGESPPTNLMAITARLEDPPPKAILSNPRLVMLMATHVWIFADSAPKKRIKALAFFDPGAQMTLVKSSLVKRLSLPKLREDELEVNYFHAPHPLKMKAPQHLISVVLEDGEVQSLAAHKTDWIVPSVRRADFEAGAIVPIDEEPDLLIGMSDFWSFFRGLEQIESRLFKVHTSVGAIICGRHEAFNGIVSNKATAAMVTGVSGEQPETEHDLMKRFWDLQQIGVVDDPKEDDDETAQRLFDQSVRRLEDGRYCVSWPWKSYPPDLPSNFAMAYRRFISLVDRLRAKPELMSRYEDKIQEQLRLGFTEVARRTGGLEHFLPHHCVITHKFRQVLSANAHPKGENSLNDCQFRGSVILADQTGLHMRFRLSRMPMWGDLEKAFNAISLEEPDREVCKMLWLKDIQKPVTPDNLLVLRWARVPFGVISSPFLLGAVVQRHLRQAATPLALELADNAYVDNLLMSCDSEEEALEKYKGSKALFSSCQMNIREFVCNSPRVMEAIPEADRLDSANPKILGVPWDTAADTLSIAFPTWSPSATVTRRVVLSQLASVFDPMGYACPSLLPSKLFLQRLWEAHSQLSWDDPIPKGEADEWHRLGAEMSEQRITLPRRGTLDERPRFQLHAFVDASKDAYAACIYLRSETPTETVAHLFFAKSRVKPKLTTLTIPRMELMAMLIGSRLLKFVEKQLRLNISGRFIWGDSKPVLSWIASKDTQPRFVENRLKEIRSACGETRILYVPTEQNPADVATRGCTPDELRTHGLWWHGPSWLCQPEAEWPITMEVEVPRDDPDPDLPQGGAILPAIAAPLRREMWIDPTRFSRWGKLQRVTVVACRFVKRTMGKRAVNDCHLNQIAVTGPIRAEDCVAAECILLKMAQRDWHTDKDGSRELRTFEDEHGLIRLRTRLANSEASTDFKCPIVLTNSSTITKLLIEDFHVRALHSGVDSTLAAFLDRFWCPKARRTVRSIVKKCCRCRKVQGPAFGLPSMPQLPGSRVLRSAPFENVGIDYLGPTHTRTTDELGKTALHKAWIVLITCLATRAVYLEPVLDLSANSFLLVLRRFASRRGTPKFILTDNGTQFILAEKVVAALEAGRIPSSSLDDYLARNAIRWRRIPQLSPWQGGVYERLVALVKNSFRRELGKKLLSWDELRTFVAEVEAVLNQRPICHISDEADGLTPLRPVDFLLPKAQLSIGTDVRESREDEEYLPKQMSQREALQARWNSTAAAVDHMWERWSKEYLLMLRERSQWTHHGSKGQLSRAPKVGEIVLMSEELQPRNCWPMARIVELQESHGAIRNVKVRMASGKILSRPVNRLYPLECGSEVEAQLQEAASTESTEPGGRIEPAPDPDENQRNARSNEKPSHSMVTRSKTRAIATTLSVILLILMCNPLTAVTFPPGAKPARNPPYCDQCKLECTAAGVEVKLPSYISKFILCCGDQDQCLIQDYAPRTVYQLPKERLIFDYRCEATYWKRDGSPRIGNIECPPREACDLIDCWFCLERLANPDCRPEITFSLVGAVSFLGFMLIFWILPMIFHITLFWILQQMLAFPIRVWRYLCGRQPRAHNQNAPPLLGLSFRPRTPNQRNRNRRLSDFLAILSSALLATSWSSVTEAGTHVTSITATAEDCLKTANGTVCRLRSSTTLTVLPVGQVLQLLLRHPDEAVAATLEIGMESLSTHCLPGPSRWLRSYKTMITSVKRCPAFGSCEGDYCLEVNRVPTEVEELKDVAMYPGFDQCWESCSFWLCGCGTAGTSCIFYRTHAVPASPKVYELKECPDWENRIRMKVTLKKGGMAIESQVTSLVPGVTFDWHDISFTPIGDFAAPMPVLGRKFLWDGENTAVVDEIRSDLLCQTREDAVTLNCSLAQTACHHCVPNHDKEVVNCTCWDSILEDYMEDVDSRMPLTVGHLTLRANEEEIYAESHYNPIQLSVQFEGLRIATEEDLTQCWAKPRELKGCYSCNAGAHLAIECRTDFGSALAYAHCEDDTEFALQCHKEAATHNVTLAFNRAEVDLDCSMDCSAGRTNFSIHGHLRYIPRHYQIPLGAEVEKKEAQDDSCWLCFDLDFDMKDVFWFFFGGGNLLRTFGILAVALWVAYLLIRMNPTLRIWRKVARLLVALLLCSQMASAEFASPGGLSHDTLLIMGNWMKETDIKCLENLLDSSFYSTAENHPSILLLHSNMVTIVSFLSNFLSMEPEELASSLESGPFRARVEHKLSALLRDGYTFRTKHLLPAERNFDLQGNRLTERGADRTGAFNGIGPKVKNYFAVKHGIELRWPTMPCLKEPQGPRHFAFFPLECVRVLPPDSRRINRPVTIGPIPRRADLWTPAGRQGLEGYHPRARPHSLRLGTLESGPARNADCPRHGPLLMVDVMSEGHREATVREIDLKCDDQVRIYGPAKIRIRVPSLAHVMSILALFCLIHPGMLTFSPPPPAEGFTSSSGVQKEEALCHPPPSSLYMFEGCSPFFIPVHCPPSIPLPEFSVPTMADPAIHCQEEDPEDAVRREFLDEEVGDEAHEDEEEAAAKTITTTKSGRPRCTICREMGHTTEEANRCPAREPRVKLARAQAQLVKAQQAVANARQQQEQQQPLVLIPAASAKEVRRRARRPRSVVVIPAKDNSGRAHPQSAKDNSGRAHQQSKKEVMDALVSQPTSATCSAHSSAVHPAKKAQRFGEEWLPVARAVAHRAGKGSEMEEAHAEKSRELRREVIEGLERAGDEIATQIAAAVSEAVKQTVRATSNAIRAMGVNMSREAADRAAHWRLTREAVQNVYPHHEPTPPLDRILPPGSVGSEPTKKKKK